MVRPHGARRAQHQEKAMQPVILSRFLRRVLLADGVICVVTGALLTLDAGMLSGPLGLPVALLFYAGAVLFPIAAFILALLIRRAVPAGMIWLLIVGNLIWTADSLLLLATPWVAPTPLGVVFIVAQAVAVAAIASAEWIGLRGSAGTSVAFAH
jgi:hypothetical protein